MNGQLNYLVGLEHAHDLRRDADRHRVASALRAPNNKANATPPASTQVHWWQLRRRLRLA